MAQVFTGEGINRFVAITVKAGLKMYGQHGIVPNRGWTPTRMLAKATEITGVKFKRGEYLKAAQVIQEMLDKEV